jgi:glycosyltransferase involved in cell wall biosynthesis
MNIKISVIIPTYNPNFYRLKRVLEGLKSQSLHHQYWEVIIVDNASPNTEIFSNLNLSWHPSAKIIREENLGLTRARTAGIQSSQGDYLVFVDDDNVLDSNYLKNVIEIFQQYPDVGVIGGKSLPEFEVEPEPWINQFSVCLALRDLGDQIQLYSYKDTPNSDKQHPKFAPIGAGMALRKSAAQDYINTLTENQERLALDRTGRSLQSGGDCDINLTVLEAGWRVGYFPQLQLTHLMPASRLTKKYLAKVSFASSRSWVQVLDLHGIRPWQKIPRWTVLPRKFRAFFRYKPWKDAVSYIRWQAACGTFEGLGALTYHKSVN